jgi:hypothetical protein
MLKLLISLVIVSLFPGCASYTSTNCVDGSYAHCDGDQPVALKARNGESYVIRDNLLFLTIDGVFSAAPANREEVLDFALQHPGLVAMYDPVADVATIHRNVVDYQGQTGQALLGLALIVVGTAAVVAGARNQERCYDRHIARYRDERARTYNNIFHSDAKRVGSERWQHDIDVSSGRSLRELSQAFDCLR